MTLLLMGVLVLQFGSISILAVEEHADGANITSASDALWYTLVTISTVGYGDRFPVTNAGRLIGTLIIVVGVGIFGTFTGYLANLFLGPGRGGAEAAETDADAAAAAADETAAATDDRRRPALARAACGARRRRGSRGGCRQRRRGGRVGARRRRRRGRADAGRL